MNSQIESWRVEQFTANVYQLAQQRGSRLASKVRSEQFKGKAEFFDRIGTATAQKKTGRNTDTPNLNIDHSRRMVTTSMYEWATLVDRKDKLQNIHNPESEYSVAARNALGRSMDDILIDSALGVAKAGEDGSSSVSLSNTQKLCAIDDDGAQDFLNIQALRKAKFLFDHNEVEGERFFAFDAEQLEHLLSHTETTNSQYNTVRALVAGEIDTFMGFTFIRTERLIASSLYSSAFTFDNDVDAGAGLYKSGGTALAGGETSCFAFVGDGLILGMNEGMVGRIDERQDKSYDTQVYASMDLGGVRMEEAKVVEVICKSA